MGGSCPEGQFLDVLVTQCIPCSLVCRKKHTNSRCTEYCVSAECKAIPGQHYDRLLRKCVRCADVCGRHPAECSHHCQTQSPLLTPPSQKPTVEVTVQTPSWSGSDSTILIYALLALCVVLMLSTLSVALAVLLGKARAKAKPSRPGPTRKNRAQEGVVQLGQEVGRPGQSSKDLSIFHPTEPPYDSSPTETCVCVHCFPDLRLPGQEDERPLRPHFSVYQQAALQQTHSHKEEPLWSQEGLHTPGLEGREVEVEAAVG